MWKKFINFLLCRKESEEDELSGSTVNPSVVPTIDIIAPAGELSEPLCFYMPVVEAPYVLCTTGTAMTSVFLEDSIMGFEVIKDEMLADKIMLEDKSRLLLQPGPGLGK